MVWWNSVAYSTIPLEPLRFRVEYATLFHPTTKFYPELRLEWGRFQIGSIKKPDKLIKSVRFFLNLRKLELQLTHRLQIVNYL